jgi:hypothetical protein
MLWLNSIYLIAIAGLPISLGFCWWGWFRKPGAQSPKWRAMLFLSGLCTGTANCILFWAWAAWLHFHYTPSSWKVQDTAANIGLCLLLYSVVVAISGKGKYRVLLGVSAVLAMLPWIPMGV